jgi:hypothetical protein
LAGGEAPSLSADGAPDCRRNRQNWTISLPNWTVQFPQLRAGSTNSCSFHVANTFLVTPLGNRSSPAMAHYGMEIYNENIIMPSIYTNPEVRYTNYLSAGNSFGPSCGNYFGRV